VRNGNVFLWGEIVARDVAEPFNTYYWYPKPWYEDLFFWALYPYAAVMNYLGRALPYIADGVGYVTHSPTEVSQDMVPGSAFLNNLNAAGNLGREAAAIPYRIGVISNLEHSYGITWKGIAPGYWGELTWWQYASAFVFAAAFEYYANYWDYYDPYYWEKRWNAWLWARAAFTMVDMDPVWCMMIGAWEPNAWRCQQSDGIVPAWSQVYPAGTHQYNIYGPAHMEEKNSAELEGMLRYLLGQVYNVQTCATTPITSFTVSPTSLSLQRGYYRRASAAARNACGNIAGDQSVTWSSSNSYVASVDATGLIAGNNNGSATITARHNATGRTASLYVSVYTPTTTTCRTSPCPKEPM
jgi:uncharacterized protein YjdB